MDSNQTARMIEWLDGERRRDRARIATLEERLTRQMEPIGGLGSQLDALASEHSTLARREPPADPGDELLESLRAEFVQLLERGEARRIATAKESEQRLELLREQLQPPLLELRERLEQLERRQSDLPAMQSEYDRFTSSLAALQQRLDDLFVRLEEPERRIIVLEEQRRQDARRIDQLGAGLPELQKQIDPLRTKFELLEDLSLRSERQLRETQTELRRQQESLQEFIDQQTLEAQRHAHQVSEISERFRSYDSAMQENVERFAAWTQAFREIRGVVEEFGHIRERLEGRISELAELQRLAEERHLQEWETWLGQDQQRRKQFTLANDEVWRNHDREFERFVNTIDALRERFPPLEDALERLWRLERERTRRHHESEVSLLREFDTGAAPATNSRR